MMKKFWEKYGMTIIVAVGIFIFIIIVAAISGIVKRARQKGAKRDPNLTKEEKQEIAEWDYQPLLSDLVKVLETSYYISGSERCATYKKVAELEDNKLIKLANVYKNQEKQTINQAMDETWGAGCFWYSTNWGEVLRARMDSLSIP